MEEKMKKNSILFLAVIFCSMIIASCSSASSAKRTSTPFAISTVSTVSLPALQHSLERKDYEIIDTIEATAVVTVAESRSKLEVKADSDDFINVCNVTETGLVHNLSDSKGTLRYGFIEGLNLGNPEPCDGNSMASALAAYRLINEVKTSGADGIVSPSLYVTAEESDSGFFSRTITYKVVISAKLIKLKTQI